VIAIIAILAAILFPVFAKAREKARQASCLSNVRQLGVAILSYIQDNDEYLPHRQGPGMVWIYYQIDPYIKNAQCRICPSLNNTSQGYSYGFNWRHCCCDTVAAGWWGKDCNLAQYKTPAETLMLADTTNSQNGAGGRTGPEPPTSSTAASVTPRRPTATRTGHWPRATTTASTPASSTGMASGCRRPPSWGCGPAGRRCGGTTRAANARLLLSAHEQRRAVHDAGDQQCQPPALRRAVQRQR